MKHIILFLSILVSVQMFGQFRYDNRTNEVMEAANAAALTAKAATLSTADAGLIFFQKDTDEFYFWDGSAIQPFATGDTNMANTSLTSTSTKIHSVGAGSFSINNFTNPANSIALTHVGTTQNSSFNLNDDLASIVSGPSSVKADGTILKFDNTNGLYNIETAPTLDSDAPSYILTRRVSDAIMNSRSEQALQSLGGSGVPVNGTTKAWYVNQEYTNTDTGVEFIATTASTDPDVAATGSVWANKTFPAQIELTTLTEALIASYSNKTIYVNTATECTFTVNDLLPVGSQIVFIQKGAGKISFTPSGVVINSQGAKLKSLAQYTICTLHKEAPGVYYLTGYISS